MLQEHGDDRKRHHFKQHNEPLEDDDEDEDGDDGDDEYNLQDDSDLVNSKTINDILKYGAGHHSMDSNPGETQSEWSDEDDKDDDEAKGRNRLKTFRNRFYKLLSITPQEALKALAI